MKGSIFLVAGSDEFLRRRFVSRISQEKSREGWTITKVEGSEKDPLDSVFAMSRMFSSGNLAVVSNPEKLPEKDVSGHISDPDPNLILVLVSESDKPSGPILDLVPKSNAKVFPLPPFYRMEEYASDFVVSELKSLGRGIDPTLARDLVRKVGTNLGVLSFEVQKVCHLVESGGKVEPKDLRSSLSALAETDGSAVVDSLGFRDRVALARELVKFRKSRGADPTIELCGRVLTPTLIRWLQAAHLEKVGMSPAAAAGSVGSNPWFWEHKVLPPARSWGVEGSARLLKIVAKSQTLVFQGAISPFAYLEAALLASFPG